jgi:hypothetical protein
MAPVFAIDGRFDGVLVTCEPIDRERFAQNSLGALRQALESVGEMVFEIDQRGAVLMPTMPRGRGSATTASR